MELNALLVNLYRSLLQYVAECRPWTDAEHEAVVNQLADRQREDVRVLVDFLVDCDMEIDFGTYPTEYTDLHYLSLEILIRRLVDNQQSLVTVVNQTAAWLNGDDQAAELIRCIGESQNGILQDLQSMLP